MSKPPFVPIVVDLSPEEAAREHEVYGGLASSVRRVMTASLRTALDYDEVERLTVELDRISERLESEQGDAAKGVTITPDGRVRAHGNAVVGLRNPVAVPLLITQDPEERSASSRFHLGGLYEGPPGCVHGGVLALVLDQVFGEAAAAGGAPGMTGTLTIRYRRPTPLGDCSATARVDRVEGIKTIVRGELHDAAGRLTVQAEGIFVMPRWVREAMAHGEPGPVRFE